MGQGLQVHHALCLPAEHTLVAEEPHHTLEAGLIVPWDHGLAAKAQGAHHLGRGLQ